MKLSTAALMALMSLKTSSAQEMRTCSANPECAALELVDNCCPTSLAGIFLDCCETAGASCSANAGCADLAISGQQNNCCPAEDGTYLYCCFEPDPDAAKYEKEFTFWADAEGLSNAGSYIGSTGNFLVYGAPGHLDATYTYQRGDALYDLIYIEGEFSDIGQYVTGEKVLSMSIASTSAPECTQVMLQFDSLPISNSSNYPAGRHSRYLGTLAPGQNRIQFNFLDRPDENVLDEDVNAMAIFLDPGSTSTDTYSFYNLDSYVSCETGENCAPGPTKSCPALYVEIAGAEERRSLQEESGCSDCRDPACMGVGECNVEASLDDLEVDPNFQEMTAPPSVSPGGTSGQNQDEDATSNTDTEVDVDADVGADVGADADADENDSNNNDVDQTPDLESDAQDQSGSNPIFPQDVLDSGSASFSYIGMSVLMVNLAAVFAL